VVDIDSKTISDIPAKSRGDLSIQKEPHGDVRTG
jgi:hypothetical protein